MQLSIYTHNDDTVTDDSEQFQCTVAKHMVPHEKASHTPHESVFCVCLIIVHKMKHQHGTEPYLRFPARYNASSRPPLRRRYVHNVVHVEFELVLLSIQPLFGHQRIKQHLCAKTE